MNKSMLLILAVVLASCGKPEPTETVESLVANPERLKELRAQCKTDRAKLGDELCNRVAEATNRRFLGMARRPTTRRRKPPSSDCHGLSRNFAFLTRYVATRSCSRNFSSIRRDAKSCFFLDISSDNGL